MYAMLATLIVWALYFTVRLFRDRHHGMAAVIGLELLLLAIINTHALGFVAVLLDGLYGLCLVLRRPRDVRGLRLWLALFAIAAIGALPWLASGLLHDANLHAAGGIAGIADALGAETLGEIAYAAPGFLVPGVLAYCLLVVIGLRSTRLRALTAIFLILPLALSLAAALWLKPLFKWNIFSTMAAPFIAIIAARAFSARDGAYMPRIASLSLLVLLLLAASVATRLTDHVSSGFRDRANLIRANYRPGDLVYAPQQSVFWGAAWYLEGPDWGSPLTVAAPPNPQWRALYRRLGPHLVKSLHLLPDRQLLDRHGIRILAGNGSSAQAAGASRVWLLTMPRADLQPGFPPARLAGLPVRWSDHQHTWLTLYAATPQKVRVPPALAHD
jgi:hypothetical protein